jgi:5-formaminoimidazole-4-carboxamide-1-beta-D-ribofuranosyl 5'-monophosphate synthetase
VPIANNNHWTKSKIFVSVIKTCHQMPSHFYTFELNFRIVGCTNVKKFTMTQIYTATIFEDFATFLRYWFCVV